MADDRRPARGARPRGRTGPGRTPGAGRPRRPSGPAGDGRASGRSAARPGAAATRGRPRPTGRLAIVVLVLAVLAISYASSLRAYLQQRAELERVRESNAEKSASIAWLAREIQRQEDPAFVEQDARRRLSYVMPGETVYVVLDENGQPLEPEAELSAPTSVDSEEPEAWWSDAWASVELAGDPPKAGDPLPLEKIDGSKEGSGE